MSNDPPVTTTSSSLVGPVLRSGPVSSALVDALRAQNTAVEVVDRGAYLRVLAPQRLVLERTAAESALGRPFLLPGELELVMISFSGRISVTDERAEWFAR